MLTMQHREALRDLALHIHTGEITWALTGSTSFALQGVPVEAHDIDVQTDRDGAYAIERIFAAQMIRPVRFSSTEKVRSHFGALLLHGIEVELMGDLQKRLSYGTWEESVDLRPLIHWLELEEMRIPVLDLVHEQRAYTILGRVERATLLADFLKRQRR